MGFVIRNIRIGPKMIAVFLLVAAFSGVIGVLGIVGLNRASTEIQTVQNQSWVVADSAMEIHFLIEEQILTFHEYMVGETEAKAEYQAVTSSIQNHFSSLAGVLGQDYTLLIQLTSQYQEFRNLVEGNTTTDGIFTMTDNYFQDQADLKAKIETFDDIHHEITDLVLVIEENAEVSTGNGNATVANDALHLNLEIWEAFETVLDYAREEDVTELLTLRSEFNWIYDDPTNAENLLARLDDIEGCIDGALLDGSVESGTDLVFDQVKARLTVGTVTTPAWIVMVRDTTTEVFALQDDALLTLSNMDAHRDLIHTKVSALEVILDQFNTLGDGGMATSVNTVIENSTAITLLVLTITVGLVILAAGIAVVFARSITKPIGAVVEISEAVSQGDLSRETTMGRRGDEIGALMNSFGTMINFLTPAIQQIAATAENVSGSAQEMASSAEEVNASSEEISSIAQQMSRGSQQQTDQINAAVKLTEEMANEFNVQIQGISAASDLIESISGQVNMLALNASIEAARAGEYGRGFAVVADNIRRLADEAKQSLVGINQIIERLRTTISGSINTITDAIQNAASISEETAAGAEEASAATEEQAATMQEMSASAQELAKVALDLQGLVQKFRLA
ncbi:MAG: methyl-accepting chemotaxis protein [Candidatus Hodarchaeota archaeon]